MAKNFFYKARNAEGRRLSGQVVADSQAAAAAFVRDKGWFVTQIKEQQRLCSLNVDLRNFRAVGLKDLAVFCRLFATMAGAGISFVNCLSILQEQSEHPRLKSALADIYKRVREGESLAQSLAAHPGVFPQLMIGMVEAGEAGGVLDRILQRLAALFEKEYKTREKVKSALTYPALVSVLACGVVLFILTFVLPTFTKIFEGSRIELPAVTKFVLAISLFCQMHGTMLLLAAAAFFAMLALALRRPAVREWLDAAALDAPLFGPLLRKVAIARFAHTLGTLTRSGLPILSALEMARRASDNRRMKDVLEQAQTSVKGGANLASPLADSRLFPPMVVQMITIGEEAGELDAMLEKISEFYEEEVDETVRRLSTLIEPLLIVFLGLVIGGIVLSVMLPMFDLTMNIGH